MWDTVQSTTMVLSHDMPCAHCGHALHVYLACGDGCDCAPQVMPGATPPDASGHGQGWISTLIARRSSIAR